MTSPEESGEEGGQQLAFSANVWNAGPSPLVVDGFRRPGTNLMDAYQYFYDRDGEQVGFVHTGTLEFDEREGHHHWHFTDFARYRLLKADKREAVRSGKEAFCLVPTDSVDLTVKGANWKPGSTGLSTACGEVTSLAIRETLDVGWGNTYSQSLPGQAFDLTDLPNETYYIENHGQPGRPPARAEQGQQRLTAQGNPRWAPGRPDGAGAATRRYRRALMAQPSGLGFDTGL